MEEITCFTTIVDTVRTRDKKTVVVADAAEPDVIAATVQAWEDDLAHIIYVGDAERIRQFADETAANISGIEIIDEKDPWNAAKNALELVKNDDKAVLMKGKIGTSLLLGIILKDDDLKQRRPKPFVSHVSVFEWKHRLKIFSDAGLNIAPDVSQKKRITFNAIEVAHKLGMNKPRVAFLSAVEKVSSKMISSVEAAELAEMPWEEAIVGGPLAFDGAMFEQAYQIKGVPSPVEGKADILICPNIETGNILYKTLAWMLQLDMAGIITGAAIPCILTSRADNARVKFLSIATTLYLAK
jgi:phosphate butyryltransferase